MESKITNYTNRIKFSKILLVTQKPFAYKMSNIAIMKEIEDSEFIDTCASCIIALEELKESYFEELIKYKMIYGEIDG